jgi:hypothetical protein
MNFYQTENIPAIKAKFEAQKIAFGPFMFQAAMALRDLGILKAIENHGKKGATAAEIAKELNLSEYGVKVLAEAGLGMGLFLWDELEKKFVITKVGFFLLYDDMTKANMDFVQDVNYQGFYHLKEAILSGKPEGLKVFGDWPTLYEALAHFPPKVRDSWLDFDHFYSDAAFDKALDIVFASKPKRLLDVGGNTGKWTLQCLQFDPEVQITIADLPGQLRMAEKNLVEKGHSERVTYHGVNLLDPTEKLPTGNQAIWMSQFLDCFSQEEIVSILSRAAAVMNADDHLYILETYWDRQKYEAAAFCLQQTSLYFTCIANGNSQMYHSDDMKACLEKAGLEVILDTDNIGISHTLFKCKKK